MYLSIEEATKQLTFKDIEIPEKLENLLFQIEERINLWLGKTLALTFYEEILESTSKCQIFLLKSPVVEVVSVRWRKRQIFQQTPEVIAAKKQNPTGHSLDAGWNDSCCIWDEKNIIDVEFPDTKYRVEYYAGYENIPSVVSEAVHTILGLAINNGGLEFLDQPIKDVSSLSIPGGLSQSFKVANSDKESKIIDRLLSGLTPYRRIVFYG